MELVAAGGEVEWFHFPLSSKCSTKEPFGIWEDEEEKKRAIESERAECGSTSAESWEEQRSEISRIIISKIYYKLRFNQKNGDVAQMVERSLSMREVRGSIPRISMSSFVFISALIDPNINQICFFLPFEGTIFPWGYFH